MCLMFIPFVRKSLLPGGEKCQTFFFKSLAFAPKVLPHMAKNKDKKRESGTELDILESTQYVLKAVKIIKTDF